MSDITIRDKGDIMTQKEYTGNGASGMTCQRLLQSRRGDEGPDG